MPLSKQDQEYIREVSANVAADVSDRIITKVMEWHVSACPHGKSILMAKWLIVGMCIASSIGGGGFTALLLKVL